MSTPSNKLERKTKICTKLKLLFKARGATIVGIVILAISVFYLAHQTIRVVAAMDRWVALRAAGSSSGAVDAALESINNEETMLIAPLGLTLLSFVVAFHSVKLKIIPKKCFYCGRWAHARNVKQTPDKIFCYHEDCEVNMKHDDNR